MTVLAERNVSVPASPPRFSNRRAYAQTFAATAFITGMGIVSGIFAARLLGPVGRGELAVIVFLPMLLTTLGALELPRSVAFETSRLGQPAPVLIATSFWLTIALGVLQALVLMMVLPAYLSPDKLHLLNTSRWFMLYLPAAFITTTLMGTDQGRGQFGRFSLLLSLPGILYVVAILVVWKSGHVTPARFAFGVLASMVMTAGFRTAIDFHILSRTKPDWNTAKSILKRGFSYYVPAVTGFLLLRCDMFLAVRLMPMRAIGLYAVAQAIAMGQLVTLSPFVYVSFAAVAAEREKLKIQQAVLHHFRLAQLVAIAMGLVTATATPFAIRLFFGARFIDASGATFLLIAGTVFSGMAQVLDQSLRAASYPRPGILSNFVGMVMVFVVGIPGFQHYGISGMAASVLIGQISNLAILLAFCLITFDVSPIQFWAFDARTLREALSLVGAVKRRLGWAN